MTGIMQAAIGTWIPAATSSTVLVYDLDAANYAAVPTTGSTVAGTGGYTITVANSGSSISWQSANGGVFRKSNNVGTDAMYGGPNWVTGQNYSVFMTYKRSATADGRLLNTQNEASADWLMGLYNGNPNTFYPNGTVNLPSTGADLVWHFGWATLNATTGVGQLWISSGTQPSTYSYTATNAGFRGFNQLRLFSRASGSEVQTADIGFVKVYNGVLTTAEIQAQYTTYAARFGY